MTERREIYLDNSATTPLLPEVREALAEAMATPLGNPSSDHAAGERSREVIRHARESVAELLSANPKDLVFTSGATEANNLALSKALHDGCARVVTTMAEHSSVLRACEAMQRRHVEVEVLPVDPLGRVDLERLEKALVRPASLVSIHWVNSETGVIQPIVAVQKACQAAGVPLHVDAAQAVGRLPIDLTRSPVDYLSLSGHKFHGPVGVGALVVAQRRSLYPLLWGGGQEGGLRAGTENTLGILGMAVAARIRKSRELDLHAKLGALRDHFEDRVIGEIAGVTQNGGAAGRAPGVTNLRFDGVDGQALVARLDLAGICCSQSSACTSARPEPSHVLRAMGLSEEEAYSSVRFSFSVLNTSAEVDVAVGLLRQLVEQLRHSSARLDAGMALIREES